VTTTARLVTLPVASNECRPIEPRAAASDLASRLHDVVVLESCHSTWIFDPRQLQFCRILKGIEVDLRPVVTEWRPYWQLHLDPQGEGFTVYLNAARTRLLRSWRHTRNCDQCGGSGTAELSLEDIHLTLHGYRA
jgi:hypothetical protein